jgi:hypothetical protein
VIFLKVALIGWKLLGFAATIEGRQLGLLRLGFSLTETRMQKLSDLLGSALFFSGCVLAWFCLVFSAVKKN